MMWHERKIRKTYDTGMHAIWANRLSRAESALIELKRIKRKAICWSDDDNEYHRDCVRSLTNAINDKRYMGPKPLYDYKPPTPVQLNGPATLVVLVFICVVAVITAIVSD